MKRIIVTTSWDDGHILDLRLAALLKKYKIAGTLYMSPDNREIAPAQRLSSMQIQQLSKDFEIGSHTMTHPVLTTISLKECQQELVSSKQYLEALLKKNVTSFCYPRGAYNDAVAAAVKDTGYKYARTVEDYVLQITGNKLTQGTSVEAYRFSIPALGKDLLKLAKYCNWNPWKIIENLGWEQRAKTIFDDVYKNGGVFHLWGHSWVLEKAHDWQKLERVLSYIHGRSNVDYLTNSELLNETSAR